MTIELDLDGLWTGPFGALVCKILALAFYLACLALVYCFIGCVVAQVNSFQERKRSRHYAAWLDMKDTDFTGKCWINDLFAKGLGLSVLVFLMSILALTWGATPTWFKVLLGLLASDCLWTLTRLWRHQYSWWLLAVIKIKNWTQPLKKEVDVESKSHD